MSLPRGPNTTLKLDNKQIASHMALRNVGTDGTFPMYHTNNWGTFRLSPVFQNHNYLLQALTVRISLEPESTTMSTYRQEVLKQLAAR